MRVAIILPESQSDFRHRGVPDNIHLSGLLTLAVYLDHHGHIVQVFDYLADEGASRAVLDARLFTYQPTVLIVGTRFRTEDVAEFLDRLAPFMPQPHTICVGTGAVDYRYCLERVPELDFVVPVFPEPIIDSLLRALENNDPIVEIAGVASRNGDAIRFQPAAADGLQTIIEHANIAFARSAEDSAMAYLWGSRGCWYQRCTFCTIGVASSLCHGFGWQSRPIDDLVCDIQALYTQGIRRFHFLDAEFIGPGQNGQERARVFARKIIDADLDIAFFFDARVDCLGNSETIRLLKQAGLATVFIGVESCSDAMLNRLGKGVTFQEIELAVANLRRWNVPFKCGWMLADPQANMEEVAESLAGVRKLGLFTEMSVAKIDHHTGVGSIFHEVHLHAGTRLYADAQQAGYDLQLSETRCHYTDERVQALFRRAAAFRQEISRRYHWLETASKQRQWVKQYEFALRVLAFRGLERLVHNMLINDPTPDETLFADVLHKHDLYWLSKDFPYVQS